MEPGSNWCHSLRHLLAGVILQILHGLRQGILVLSQQLQHHIHPLSLGLITQLLVQITGMLVQRFAVINNVFYRGITSCDVSMSAHTGGT